MNLSSKNNQFRFEFPRTFIPKQIADKYRPLLNKMPGTMITEPIDYFNYGIQSLNVPGPSFEPVSQNDNPGLTRKFRTSTPRQENFDKSLSVTMQSFDGWVNYWLAVEIYEYYYSRSTKQQYIPEGIGIELLDFEGFAWVNVKFKDMLMTGVSELDLNFSSNTVEFQTFTISFTYNFLDIVLNYDK